MSDWVNVDHWQNLPEVAEGDRSPEVDLFRGPEAKE